MAETVLSVAVCQGTVLTRSVAVPTNAVALVGELQLSDADLADPGLWVGLEVHAYRPFGLGVGWCLLGEREQWQGGPGRQPPRITRLAAGQRVRLSFDLSRPASVGATITTN